MLERIVVAVSKHQMKDLFT